MARAQNLLPGFPHGRQSLLHQVSGRWTPHGRQTRGIARIYRWPTHRRGIAGCADIARSRGSRVRSGDGTPRVSRARRPAKRPVSERQGISSVPDEFDSLRERWCCRKARHQKKSDGRNAPRGGVHLSLPPEPVTHHRPSSAARFLMAVNRKLPQERWNLDPGLLLKDESRGANSPQTFLKCFWSAMGSSELWSDA